MWYVGSVIAWVIINVLIALLLLKHKSKEIEILAKQKIPTGDWILTSIISSFVPIWRFLYATALVYLIVMSKEDFEEFMKNEEKK
jgi:hypothetical protein